MTRSGDVASTFSRDQATAVVLLLKEREEPLTAAQIKKLLIGFGILKSTVDAAWPGVQRKLVKRPDVVSKNKTYQWTTPPSISPLDAFDAILKGRLAPLKKAELADIVREAITATAVTVQVSDPQESARHRQAVTDAVRALAELAMEVEELTAKDADAKVMTHRVRAKTRQSALEPIERAGEKTTFDRAWHRPIGRSIDDGASVVVVRPGYSWKGPYGDLLLEKALVVE